MENLSWKTFIKASICLFVLWLATTYWHSAVQLALTSIRAAAPLLIGLIIAYIVNLLMSFYERQACFQKFLFSEIPVFIDKLLKDPNIKNLLPTDITNDLVGLDWNGFLNKLMPVLSSGLGTIGSLVSSVFSTAVTLLVSLIFRGHHNLALIA